MAEKPKPLSPQEQEARRKRFLWQEGDLELVEPPRSQPESSRKPSQRSMDAEAEQLHPLPRRVAEVLSWGLLVQLIRRHPTQFWLRTTYPMEGIPYDCLTLCPRKDPTNHTYLEVNRTGVNARIWLANGETLIVPWVAAWANRHEAESIAFLRATDFWDPPQDIQAPNRVWILERERELGLEAPVGGLPPSSPASLALRWIAQFLAIQLTSEQPWYAYSADVAGLSERGSRLHPHHREWQAQHPEPEGACLAWLLIRGGDTHATFGLSADGDLWTPEQHVHLPRVHRSGEPVTRFVIETAGRSLP